MRRLLICSCLCVLAGGSFAASSLAGPVVFGESWDGPSNTLQSIVDLRYGAGRLRCDQDYIGARPDDPDPFYWVDSRVSAFLVREVAGNASRNVLGWYLEPLTGPPPVIDGVEDGVVFDGPAGGGGTAIVNMPGERTRFGFYLDPNGPEGITNAPQPEHFFTNRSFNDAGPDGSGALHSPAGGDVQALVFDISAWTEPNTWLVCFEDLDSGAQPGTSNDNDFNDLVFEVHAMALTPVVTLSFGALKSRYR
jgi:uncharacterized protein DUF4114